MLTEINPVLVTKRLAKLTVFLAVVLLALYYALQFFYGERVTGEGLGWDGALYAGYASWPLANLFHQAINPYYLQRILPSMLVHIGAKLFAFNLGSAREYVIAFSIYNFCLLAIAAFLFYRIGKTCCLALQTQVFSLSLLLLNFANLKLTVYYPVLTDTSAFLVGVLAIYFYIHRNSLGLFLTIVSGAFVNPILIYVNAPLFIFPRPITFKEHVPIANYLIPSLITLCVCLAIYYFINGITSLLLLLSLFSIALYLFVSLKFLIDVPFFKNLFHQFSWQNFLIFLGLLGLCKLIVYHYANGELPTVSTLHFITLTAYLATAQPFIFLVSHLIYFGPGVVFLVFLWRNIAKSANEMGTGCVIFVFMYLLLAMDSESRHLINAWPMFVLLIGYSLNSSPISWSFTSATVLLSIILSHCWLPINSVDPVVNSLYFMNFGPWLSAKMYLVFAMLFLLVSLTVHYMLKTVVRCNN